VVARADQVDADAVGRGTLEGGRLRLEPLGRDPVAQVGRWPGPIGGPAQQVHRSLLPRQRHRHADQTVLTGVPAGAERAEAGHGGGREAGSDGLHASRSSGQERHLLAVGVQLHEAEAVNDQQAHPAHRLDAKRVGDAGDVRRAQQRRDHIGQGRLAGLREPGFQMGHLPPEDTGLGRGDGSAVACAA
jgi:hypothetical protein